MNGYEMMADSYRQLVKQRKIDKETADRAVSMTFLPPAIVTIYVEWWTARHLMTSSELTSKWLSRVRTLTRTQEKKWSNSSAGCSMKRQRNRFLRADKARTQSRQRVEIFSAGENTTRP